MVGGQAYKWFRLTLTGRDSHAGTTPMAPPHRADALLAASNFMVTANTLAMEGSGFATVGIMHVRPGSINTIPNEVEFTLDIRHPSDDGLAALERAIFENASAMLPTGCDIRVEKIFDSPAVTFHTDCIDAVYASAVDAVGEGMVRRMHSGAGHDSCSTSKRCPTAMIFVPSKGGLSHNPKEYTSPEDW